MSAVVAKNTMAKAISLGLKTIIALGLVPFLIHHLGKQTYASWILAATFAISGYLSLFTLGLQGAVVKFVANYRINRDHEQIRETVSAALAVYAAGAVLASACLATFNYWFAARLFHIPENQIHDFHLLLWLLSAQILIDLPALALDGMILGFERYDLESWIDLGRSIAFAVGTVWLLDNGADVIALGYLSLGLSIGVAVAWLCICRRLMPSLRPKLPIRRATAKKIFGFSSKLFVIRLAAVVYNQMDKALLAAFLVSTVVADYDVAYRIQAPSMLLMGLLPSVLLGSVSATFARGGATEVGKLYLRCCRYAGALALPPAVITAVLARPVIVFWIGPAYAADAQLVFLFIAHILIWLPASVGWNTLVGSRYIDQVTWIGLGSTAVNLAASVLLVHPLGAAGVLWGTLIGDGIASIFYIRLLSRAFSINVRKWMADILGPAYGAATLGGLAAWGFLEVHAPQSLIQVALYACVGEVLALTAFVTLGISSSERGRLMQFGRSVIGTRLAPANANN